MVDFYTSCTNGNMKNTVLGITKFATLPQVCLYTTWENLKTHTTAHFESNCQCILMLNAINGKVIWRLSFPVLVRKFPSRNSLLAENLLHSHRFSIKILFSKLNIRSIIHLHSKHSCRVMWCNYTHSLVDHRRWRVATADDHSIVFLLRCSLSCDISFSWLSWM